MKRWIVGLVVVLACGSQARAGVSYSLGGDFSASNNPNGVWSYGYSASVGGTPTLFTEKYHDDGRGFDVWSPYPLPDSPQAAHNPTSSGLTWSNAALDPGQFAVAPKTNTEYALARWTAPEAGTYTVSAIFEGMQWRGANHTTTDVHLLWNGVSQFSGNVDGWVGRSYVSGRPREGNSPEQMYTATLGLNKYDVLDFVVGNGGNGYYDDLTGISANITRIPIPGDANLDGTVNDVDASILGLHWQQSDCDWSQGDFNYDGLANDRDAAILAAHWLATTNSAETPEPCATVLLLAGLASVLVWRTRILCLRDQ